MSDSERNFNGFADPATAVVCSFHRLLGPNFGFFGISDRRSLRSLEMICFVCFCVCLRHSYCGFYSQTRLTENGLKVVTCCQREVPFNRYLLRQLGLSDILQPAEGGFGNYLLNIAGSNVVLFFNIEN